MYNNVNRFKGQIMGGLTQQIIKEAFLTLLNKKSIDKITVKEIVDFCDINRNTFYYHYADIYDLFDSVICDFFSDCAKSINNASNWNDAISFVCAAAEKNKKLLKNSCSGAGEEIFWGRLSTFFESLFLQTLKNEDKTELAFFYRCAFCGLIRDWLKKPQKNDLYLSCLSFYRTIEKNSLK